MGMMMIQRPVLSVSEASVRIKVQPAGGVTKEQASDSFQGVALISYRP
jgi:hypothetical protein